MPRWQIALLSLLFLVPHAFGAGLKVDAKIVMPKVGDNPLTVTVTDPDNKPVTGAKITLTVQMTNMNMGVTHPKVTENEHAYIATVHFSMEGPWRVAAKVEVKGEKTVTKNFEFKIGVMDGMAGMSGMSDMAGMKGRLGDWSMAKEGSGTSWLPESSPMFMKMLPKSSSFDLSLMGSFSLNTTSTSGPRGNSRFYSNSMPMLMARKETGGGILGLNLMVSLDPIFNGEYGYPDLFQTGETAYGKQLVDYQHPHDLIDEVTASFSRPIGKDVHAYIYGGPVGEPALGGPVFMHRPSGMEIPEAPITHHWFDSTHISWGVATVGVNTSKWQLEASVFNGHEPDENRYSPDPIRFDSSSTRVTFNPGKEWSLNAAYGFLKSPESTEPGVNQHRITASALWSHDVGHGDNLSVTGLFGRNMAQGKNSDGYLLEATYLTGPTSIFARWEHVDKDELSGVPAGDYEINKFLVGGVRNFLSKGGFDLGVGAYGGFYIFPDSLDPYYGKSPLTFGVFLRIRPSKM